ncbi:MAG: class I adenylate-forming enzyme family protein [Pigmentiphaga sp.]
MRLIEMLQIIAAQDPERKCLIDESGSRSYREVWDAACVIAEGLRRQGVRPGTRVAMYGTNSADHMEGIFGILAARCVWVPLNARNTPTEIASYMRRLEIDTLLHTASVTDKLSALRELMPQLNRIFCVDRSNGADVNRDGWVARPTHLVREPQLNGSDLVSIMSSSGTTGEPKGIALTEISWSFGAATLAIHYPSAHPVYLLAAPISHAAGGLGLMLLARGATYVILPDFDAETVMSTIERYRVTQLFLPPTAIYMMLDHPRCRDYDYSSIEYFMYAGAPMSTTKLREALGVFGPVMTQFYAQMECFASITNLTTAQHAEALANPKLEHRLASAGKATTFVHVEFMDSDGRLVADGERGEIVVRSHLTFSHYLGTDDRGDQRPDGWHHTGDVGYRDSDGYIYIVDRLRDMIITGGFNVYPAEVEQVVMAHPVVKDCAVVGIPDDKWGEAVTAVVECKDGQAVDAEELIAFCRERLSGVKTPKHIVIVDSLPRSPVGKVLRRAVRQPYWNDRARAV